MNEVAHLHRMIVAEALGTGMVGGVVGSVTTKLRGVANSIGDWARNKVRPEIKIPLVTYNVLIKDMAVARYSDISTVKITTPRGLKGPLNVYAEALFDSLVKVENIEEEVLKPFSIWLSLRIAAPDSLSSAATVTDLKNFKEQDIEGVREALGKLVDPTGRVDALPLQQVYESIGVIKPTWDNANALATRYLETNPQRIVKMVGEISGKIDRLIEIIEAGKDEGSAKLSAQTATILSGITMNMAMAVDLYGQLGILIRELVVACDHQVKELRKPLQDSAKTTMVKESLVVDHEPAFVFGGIKIPHQFVYDQLAWKEPTVVDISELDWIFDHVPCDPMVGEGERSWQDSKIGAIRIGTCLYPVHGLDMLAAMRTSAAPAVECLVMSVEDVVKEFTGQSEHATVYTGNY